MRILVLLSIFVVTKRRRRFCFFGHIARTADESFVQTVHANELPPEARSMGVMASHKQIPCTLHTGCHSLHANNNNVLPIGNCSFSSILFFLASLLKCLDSHYLLCFLSRRCSFCVYAGRVCIHEDSSRMWGPGRVTTVSDTGTLRLRVISSACVHRDKVLN